MRKLDVSPKMAGAAEIRQARMPDGSCSNRDTSQATTGCPVYYPRTFDFTLGDYTKEFGPPKRKNQFCCVATEGCRACNALRAILSGHKINGKAIRFTGTYLIITIAGWSCRYTLPQEVILDIVRFDRGVIYFGPETEWHASNKRRVQAEREGYPFKVKVNSEARKIKINTARATLKAARKAGTAPPARTRNRMAVAERELEAKGLLV